MKDITTHAFLALTGLFETISIVYYQDSFDLDITSHIDSLQRKRSIVYDIEERCMNER